MFITIRFHQNCEFFHIKKNSFQVFFIFKSCALLSKKNLNFQQISMFLNLKSSCNNSNKNILKVLNKDLFEGLNYLKKGL